MCVEQAPQYICVCVCVCVLCMLCICVCVYALCIARLLYGFGKKKYRIENPSPDELSCSSEEVNNSRIPTEIIQYGFCRRRENFLQQAMAMAFVNCHAYKAMCPYGFPNKRAFEAVMTNLKKTKTKKPTWTLTLKR